MEKCAISLCAVQRHLLRIGSILSLKIPDSEVRVQVVILNE